jgi:acyl dehydratase
MALDYQYLKTLPPLVIEHNYVQRDTVLYALGVGAGLSAATNEEDIKFVYEDKLVALPTMAVILAYPGFWSRDPRYGITWQKLLHVEQSIELHAELPVEGHVRGEMTIDEIFDRGAEKGALMHFSRRIYDSLSGNLLATVRQVNLLRADGGFGGPAFTAKPASACPDRDPDLTLRLPTGIDQAMIYRLSGDTNPIHIDPGTARESGFERPILHGLSTFGVVGRAVQMLVCGNDPRRFKRFEVRFTSPVYPGETIETRVWHDGDGRALIEAHSVDRGIAVVRNGLALFEH